MPPYRFGKVRPCGDVTKNVREASITKAKARGGQELFRGLCTRNRPLALVREEPFRTTLLRSSLIMEWLGRTQILDSLPIEEAAKAQIEECT